VCPLEEQFLSLSNTVLDGYLRILWKVFIAYNELMQLITEEVGTGGAAMTVVNGEETAPGPVLHLLKLGLDYVENDGDAILVVVTDNTLMSVRRVATDDTVLLAGKLGRMIRLHKPFDLLLLHLHVLLLLLDCHDEATVSC
jgi:hypothetical protein